MFCRHWYIPYQSCILHGAFWTALNDLKYTSEAKHWWQTDRKYQLKLETHFRLIGPTLSPLIRLVPATYDTTALSWEGSDKEQFELWGKFGRKLQLSAGTDWQRWLTSTSSGYFQVVVSFFKSRGLPGYMYFKLRAILDTESVHRGIPATDTIQRCSDFKSSHH